MQTRDRGGPALRLQALLYPGIDPIKNRPSHLRAVDPMLRADMMDYFWDTVETCVAAETILSALREAGFPDASRSVTGGILSEYSGVRPH